MKNFAQESNAFIFCVLGNLPPLTPAEEFLNSSHWGDDVRVIDHAVIVDTSLKHKRGGRVPNFSLALRASLAPPRLRFGLDWIVS